MIQKKGSCITTTLFLYHTINLAMELFLNIYIHIGDKQMLYTLFYFFYQFLGEV